MSVFHLYPEGVPVRYWGRLAAGRAKEVLSRQVRLTRSESAGEKLPVSPGWKAAPVLPVGHGSAGDADVQPELLLGPAPLSSEPSDDLTGGFPLQTSSDPDILPATEGPRAEETTGGMASHPRSS